MVRTLNTSAFLPIFLIFLLGNSLNSFAEESSSSSYKLGGETGAVNGNSTSGSYSLQGTAPSEPALPSSGLIGSSSYSFRPGFLIQSASVVISDPLTIDINALNGKTAFQPGQEVALLRVKLNGDGAATLNSIKVSVDKLSSGEAIATSAFGEFRLYKSANNQFDTADTRIGSVTPSSLSLGQQLTVPATTGETIPATGMYFFVTVTLGNTQTDGRSFRPGFTQGGIVISSTQLGQTIAASDANKATVDVIATQLVYTTQPAPLAGVSGVALDFTTDPVVEARDASGNKDVDFTDTVTLTETGLGTATYITVTGQATNSVQAIAGVARFTGLRVTYMASASGESFALQADDTESGGEGNITILPTSGSISAPFGTGGMLVASAAVSEPVGLLSTASSASGAVSILDFTLTDGGVLDSHPLKVSQLVLHTSGSGPFDKVVFRLNGPDADHVTGVYRGSVNTGNSYTITFGSLAISVADGQSETYTVEAYYSNNAGLTEGQTFVLSLDGDVDLTLVNPSTQMLGTNAAVTNGSGSTVDITATKLVLTSVPSSGIISGKAFQPQPVVEARDAFDNVDLSFVDQVSVSNTVGGGSLGGTTTVTASSGVATFTDVQYNATADSEAFTLQLDDASVGSEGDLPAIATSSLSADVVATKLVFTTQPSGALHGRALATQPVVQAQDAAGLLDVNYTQEMTLAVSSPSTLTSGTATATAGQATFSGVAVGVAGSGRTLTASAQYVGPGTSAEFDVAKAGAAVTLSRTSVAYNGQPQGLVATTLPAGLPVVVTYYDGNGALSGLPGAVGSYAVVAAVAHGDYAGQASGTFTIEPPPPPVAGLKASVTQGNPPLQVTFADASSGDINSWFLAPAADGGSTFGDRSKGTTVTYSQPGPHEAVLTVKGLGGEDQAKVQIVVNSPPTIESIAAASAPEDQALTLDLSGKDSQSGTWSVEGADEKLISGVQVEGETAVFKPVKDAEGSDEVEVVRTNQHGLSARQAVTLTWTPVDDPPVIDPLLPSPFEAQEDASISVGGTGNAKDIDSGVETLEWRAAEYDEALVASAVGSSGGVLFTPVEDKHGQTQATVYLVDPANEVEVSQTVSLTWKPENDPPQAPVALFPGDGAEEIVLSPVVLWEVKDVDEEPLTYDFTLSAAEQVVAQATGLGEPRYGVGPLRPGTPYSWHVVARDAAGTTSEGSFAFITEPDRRPPVLRRRK